MKKLPEHSNDKIPFLSKFTVICFNCRNNGKRGRINVHMNGNTLIFNCFECGSVEIIETTQTEPVTDFESRVIFRKELKT